MLHLLYVLLHAHRELFLTTFSVLLVANPKKATLHGGQSRSWSAERGEKNKKTQRSSKRMLFLHNHSPIIVCCVCVVIPFILDVRLVDVPAGVTQTEGMTQRISPHSFCGACLKFSREKD